MGARSLLRSICRSRSGEQITVASIYGAWTSPIPWREGSWIYADASVHRLISDLSALVASQRGHRIIVAGDLNILHGHGEQGSEYWQARYQTVFTRMARWGCRSSGHSTLTASNAHPGRENCRETARTYRRFVLGGQILQALPDSSISSLRRMISSHVSEYAPVMPPRNGDQVITVA